MTNYEHILELLTISKVASILSVNSCIYEALSKEYSAFNKWAERKCTGCHRGNVWVEGSERIPNPYIWSKVNIAWSDKWIDYGHGNIVSMVIFLEDKYKPSDWNE